MEQSKLEQLFKKYVEQISNPRQRQSLARVRDACDYLEKAKARITFQSVGDYCNRVWGGPKAQSIRNSANVLKPYLDGRIALQKVKGSLGREFSSTNEPLIADETIRSYVSLLKAERDDARRQKDRIIGALRKIPGVPIDEIISAGFAIGKEQSLMHRIDSTEKTDQHGAVAAILCLLDPANLQKVGLENYKNRIRSAETGEILLTKAQTQALQTFIENRSADKTGHND